jgi:diacylglycerol kinase (ATP)
MSSNRLSFLLNPAGGGGRARKAAPVLRAWAQRLGAAWRESSSPEDFIAQARAAAESGCERLFVAGGDGSQNLALQGLVGTDCAHVPLPLGSGNDFAASLGMPLGLDTSIEAALAAPLRTIDVARVGGRYFGGIAGVGFDSVANETANRVQRFRGPWIYAYAVLHTLLTFRAPHYTLHYEGGSFEGAAYLVVAANGPRFGGGMRVAPEAQLDDGLLDLVLVRAVPKPTFLRVFPRVYRGTHLGHPAVFSVRSPWLEVRLDRSLVAYGDGERFCPVPPQGLRFEAVPQALRVPDLRTGL